MNRCGALIPLLALCLTFCRPAPAETPDRAQILRVGRATIRIDILPDPPVPPAVIVDWVRRAVVVVTNYLGRYPVKELLITVQPGGHEPVNGGVTHGSS